MRSVPKTGDYPLTAGEVVLNKGQQTVLKKAKTDKTRNKIHDRDFFFKTASALCLFIYRLLTLRRVGLSSRGGGFPPKLDTHPEHAP